MHRRKSTFFSRALVMYNPWPEIAGVTYDRDEMVNSVQRFCECLEDYCGCSHTTTRHDNVNREEFQTHIKAFINKCNNHDAKVAFLYICTHGVVRDDELYLMMDDSKNPDEDMQGFLQTSISGKELDTYIKTLANSMYNRKVVIFLECCQAGALLNHMKNFQPRTLGPDMDKRERVPHNLTGMNAPVRNMASANNGYGVAVFLSCGENEASYAGVFTDSIVEKMVKNKADITVQMLSDTVKNIVYGRTRFFIRGPQTPVSTFHPSEAALGSIGGGITDDLDDEQEAMEVDHLYIHGEFLGDGCDGVIPTAWSENLEILKAKLKESEEILRKVKLEDNMQIMSEKLEKMKEEGSKLDSTETRIVFAGEIGCGKSTLINALVKAKVLPMTGAGKGCTSTILEIRLNKEDERFKAKVFFFDEKEWKAQHTILTRLASDVDDNAEAKMELNHLEALKDEIEQFLAKGMEEVIGQNATDLMQELTSYCSSGLPANSGKKTFWRIVKKVQVFLPNCEVLSKDVVLLDIPGFNDSNQTRVELAQKQFGSAEVVCILADTKRALDSSTLNDLMKELKEDYRNNRLRNKDVSFILTRSDDNMDTDAYLSELNKDSDEFKDLNSSREEIAKEKNKKKRTEMKKRLKIKCAKLRNNSCKKSFQEKLASGYKGIEHLAEATVCSVSGGDYLKIVVDDEDGLFEEEDETGVPLLQKYMHNVAEKNLRGKIWYYLTDVFKFAVELTNESVRIEQPELINSALKDKLMSSLGNQIQDIITEIGQTIGKIKEDFAEYVSKDFDEANANFLIEKWNELPHQTQKAVILRNGYFERKDRDTINLYSDVVENSVQCIVECGPALNHLQVQLEKFGNNWMKEENAASVLKQMSEKHPHSERFISAMKLRDVGVKPLRNLRSDIKGVQDLVTELITNQVKKEIVPLCEAHSRKKKAMHFIGVDFRQKFENLKESVERSAQIQLDVIEQYSKTELHKYKESVLNQLVAATTADPDQKPAAGSSASVVNEFMKDVTGMLSVET